MATVITVIPTEFQKSTDYSLQQNLLGPSQQINLVLLMSFQAVQFSPMFCLDLHPVIFSESAMSGICIRL